MFLSCPLTTESHPVCPVDMETRYPGGVKVTQYRKAKLERFAPYLLPDGLVTRLTAYMDLDCESAAHRRDTLPSVCRSVSLSHVPCLVRLNRLPGASTPSARFIWGSENTPIELMPAPNNLILVCVWSRSSTNWTLERFI